MYSHELNRLVARDTFREILCLMRSIELIIAGLRLEQLTNAEIAQLLDMEPVEVAERMRYAERRIATALPEAAYLLGDRQQRHSKPRREIPPLEWGWLCRLELRGQDGR